MRDLDIAVDMVLNTNYLPFSGEVLMSAGADLSASSVAARRGDRLLVGAVFDPVSLECHFPKLGVAGTPRLSGSAGAASLATSPVSRSKIR